MEDNHEAQHSVAEQNSVGGGWRWDSNYQLYFHRETGTCWNPLTEEYIVMGECSVSEQINCDSSNSPSQMPADYDSFSCSEIASDYTSESSDEENSSSLMLQVAGTDHQCLREDTESEKPVVEPLTYGDWIWDGEFWITADGLSYHPGLNQCFSAGQRIWLRPEDVPAPSSDVMQERWRCDRYILDYGHERHSEEQPATSHPSASASPAAAQRDERNPRFLVGTGGGSLGKSKSCQVQLRRPGVSRCHAKVGQPCS